MENSEGVLNITDMNAVIIALQTEQSTDVSNEWLLSILRVYVSLFLAINFFLIHFSFQFTIFVLFFLFLFRWDSAGKTRSKSLSVQVHEYISIGYDVHAER